MDDAKMIADLQSRVHDFMNMKLPGQPLSMHMGTNYLVQDLIGAVEALASRGAEQATVTKIVELYFRPWGAAKAAEWEFLTGDKPFTAEVAMRQIQKALSSPPDESKPT